MTKEFSMDEIYTYLKVLNKIVHTTPLYKEFAKLVIENKRNVRSVFYYYDEEVAAKFLIETEDTNIVARTENGVIYNSNGLNLAKMIITDFVIISAISKEDWIALAVFLFEKNLMTISPDSYFANIKIEPITVSNKNSIELMLHEPWLICLLLLELTVITQENE